MLDGAEASTSDDANSSQFDVPAVGIATIRRIHEMNGTALAVEASRTLLLEKDALIKEAEGLGISVVALRDG